MFAETTDQFSFPTLLGKDDNRQTEQGEKEASWQASLATATNKARTQQRQREKVQPTCLRLPFESNNLSIIFPSISSPIAERKMRKLEPVCWSVWALIILIFGSEIMLPASKHEN